MKALYSLIVGLLSFVSTNLNAQYYFNDIVAPRQALFQYQALKNNNVSKVVATSYEANNQPSEEFSLEQEVAPGAAIITTTATTPAGHTYTRTTYVNNLVQKSEDSSANVLTETSYIYDANNRLKELTIITSDTFMQSKSEEKHLWFYNSTGTPVSMLKIKEKLDTTRIVFSYDEKGNVGEEKWFRKGRETEQYLYYYNEKNQLTDIVRFNQKVKRLLPDFLYKYDELGRVSQLTQVPSNSSDYLIWKYNYNEKGLKVSEVCSNKHGQVIGTIRYNYTY